MLKSWGEVLLKREHLEVLKVPLAEAVEMVMRGEINANSSAHLILKVARMIEMTWSL